MTIQGVAAEQSAPAKTPLYLEDFHPGRSFESRPHAITAEDIVRFASEFDPQPFHIDPEAAEHTFFRGHSASGWHTAAVAMRLFVETVPVAGGLIGAGVEALEWKAPVRPGDRLSLRCRVVDVSGSKSRPDRGIVLYDHEVLNQDGKVVMTLTPKLVVLRRPDVSGGEAVRPW